MKNILKSIIGTKIKCVGRTLDMFWINFEDVTNVYNMTYCLHIQCPWRLITGKKIIVSNLDMYEYSDDKKYSDEWNEKEVNIFDEKVENLFNGREYTVKDIKLSYTNDITVIFSNSMILECFVNNLCGESWRLFKKGTREHLVIYNAEIEE